MFSKVINVREYVSCLHALTMLSLFTKKTIILNGLNVRKAEYVVNNETNVPLSKSFILRVSSPVKIITIGCEANLKKNSPALI